MTNHTPGPWTSEVEVDGRHHAVAIMAEGARPLHPLIAQALHGMGGVGKQTALANAHLIAAAPDLLLAAKDACLHIADLGKMLNANYQNSPTFKQLMAAIKKAEGK